LLSAVRQIILTPALVRVSAYGNNLAALKSALSAAQASKRLVIDVPVSVAMTDQNDPLRLFDGLRIDFVGAGSVTWDAFGLPLFWAKGVSGLRINSPVIYFSGTAQTSLPAANASFYDDVLDRSANGFPRRDVMAAFGLFGCSDVEFVNPRFLATDYSSSATLMQRAITISDYEDGSPSTNIRILGSMDLDGVTMGLLAWGVDGLSLEGMITRRWGQLNVATYTWEIACHAIYFTTQRPNYNVTVGDLVDVGPAVPGTIHAASPPHSFKFIGIAGGSVGSMVGARPSGILEWQTTGTLAAPFTFGPIEWTGTSDADMATTGAINMPGTGGPGSGLAEYTQFSTIVLNCPADMSDEVITSVLAWPEADVVRFIDFGLITINYAGNVQSSSTPLIIGAFTDCLINVTVMAPAWTVANALIVRIDNGGSDNTMDITTQGPTFASVRFVEEDTAASSGNFATFREYGTANVRTVGPTA